MAFYEPCNSYSPWQKSQFRSFCPFTVYPTFQAVCGCAHTAIYSSGSFHSPESLISPLAQYKAGKTFFRALVYLSFVMVLILQPSHSTTVPRPSTGLLIPFYKAILNNNFLGNLSAMFAKLLFAHIFSRIWLQTMQE